MMLMREPDDTINSFSIRSSLNKYSILAAFIDHQLFVALKTYSMENGNIFHLQAEND